ncbi:MAG TPA: hypothetical protein VHY08_26325 [Bacillota bacterium]|nr:hypothetical protein [Bacillota bacterium]
MLSADDLEKIRQAMIPLIAEQKKTDCGKKDQKKNQNCEKNDDGSESDAFNLCGLLVNPTPAQVLIIAGFFTGVLEVISVLVDKDQTVQIVLQGSLKQPTQLDQVMGQIGKMPFDEVMRSILENTQ